MGQEKFHQFLESWGRGSAPLVLEGRRKACENRHGRTLPDHPKAGSSARRKRHQQSVGHFHSLQPHPASAPQDRSWFVGQHPSDAPWYKLEPTKKTLFFYLQGRPQGPIPRTHHSPLQGKFAPACLWPRFIRTQNVHSSPQETLTGVSSEQTLPLSLMSSLLLSSSFRLPGVPSAPHPLPSSLHSQSPCC